MTQQTKRNLFEISYYMLNIVLIVLMMGQAVLPAVAYAAPLTSERTFSEDAVDMNRRDAEEGREIQGLTIKHSRSVTESVFLPVVSNGEADSTVPTPTPPEDVQVLLQPGVGGTVATADKQIRVTFSAHTIEQPTWARYEDISVSPVVSPVLGIGGQAFRVTAWEDATQEPVTAFEPDVTIMAATDEFPTYDIVIPSIIISMTYTSEDVWGLDLRTLALYRRDGPDDTTWERLPTAVYQEKNLLVAEVTQLGEFAPMADLSTFMAAQAVKRLALDPDNDVGHADWPGVGQVRELTYNMKLAEEVKQRLETDKCSVEIVITRGSASQTNVTPGTRAQTANNFGAEMLTTFAFDALLGQPWGTSGDGGVTTWARGNADDQALANELMNQIGTFTGRPKRGVKPGPFYGVYNSFPGPYAHVETLFLDHNFDWPVINTSFSLLTDATYTALRHRLEAMGMTCGDDPNNPPPYPDPPSAEELQRLRDLGEQNLAKYGSKYDIIYARMYYQMYGGDPISFSTGNHIQKVALAYIPGQGGLDISLVLNYNAQDDRDDLFGYGWSMPYNIRTQKYSDDSVSVVLHDGRTYHYTFDGTDYIAPQGVQETLSATGVGTDTTLIWTTIDGVELTFEETIGGLGIMTRWQDRRGNALTFEYDLSGQDNWQTGDDVPRPPLTAINDDTGRTISLTSDADSHITDMNLPDGRVFTFGYTDGHLTEITDPNGGTRRFQYDERHRMTHEWDAEDILFLQNTYDDRNRVIGQIDASGTPSSFTYDPTNGVNTFTDNLGNTTKYYHDALNRVTAVEDAEGNSTQYEYDDNYNLIKVTDPRGYETHYEYDERGNVTTRIDPIDGYSGLYYGSDETTFAYNDQNDLISLTDALGYETTYDYDGQGNLTTINHPNNSQTEFSYDSYGQPLSMTDGNNNTTSFTYDGYGNLTSTTDAEGNSTQSTYDVLGREVSYTDSNSHTVSFTYDGNDNITEITDPKGNATSFVYDQNDLLTSATDRRGKTAQYSYDENLKLTGETDPAGYQVTYEYDAMYNRIRMVDANGNETRYGYDSLYRLTSVTDAKGHVTRYGYDEASNLISVSDEQNNQTRLVYDAVNRLKYLTDPMGGQTEYCYDAEDRLIRFFNPRRAKTDYEYDSIDNLITIHDPLGNLTNLSYDAVGNLRTLTDPNQHTSEYVYDRIDRLTQAINPLGHTTTTAYDAVGNVINLTDPRGNSTSFSYDVNDNLVTITDALGQEISYQYDDEDNQTSVTDQRGNSTSMAYDDRAFVVSVTEPGGFTSEFEYDGNGNLIELTNANGQTSYYLYDSTDMLIQETNPLGFDTNYHYDSLDRLTQVTDAEDNATHYGYDGLDRLVNVTDSLSQTTMYAYDPASNLTVITDARGIATEFYHNMRDELTKEINPLTYTWEYHYDGVGNMVMRRDANWKPTNYIYDAANQLVEIQYPGVIGTSGDTVAFTYDEAGNELSMTDWNGTISHRYDVLNRRDQTVNFDGQTLAYTYDETSNLIGLTYPNGDTVEYGYDARNLLTSLQDPAGRQTSYQHDALGALTQITRPNNTTTDYSYDGANRLTSIDHQLGGASFSAFQYAMDKVGNRTQIAELRTFPGQANPVTVNTLKTYQYDAIYRLTNATTDKGQDVSYQFDAVGNRTMQSGIPQAVDPTDELEPIRPSAPIANRYQYNELNQLVETTTNFGTERIGFEYDGNGSRVEQTKRLTDGTTLLTSYLWDYENRLVGVTKQISDSTALTTTMVATYTYDGYGRRVLKAVEQRIGERNEFTETIVVTGTGGLTETVVVTLTEPVIVTSAVSYLYNGLDPIADYETVGDVTTSTYYYRANGGIAEMERLPNPQTGFAGDVYWTHTDGLGSLVDLTDSTGQTSLQVYYDEYGNLHTEHKSLLRYSYTGQEYDAETGLYHFYARYYDPAFGVWLSQDSYRGQLVNPMTLHRYQYVGNNPVNRIDVHGYLWHVVGGAVGGAVKGFVTETAGQAIDNVVKGKNPFNYKNYDGKRILASTAGGAVEGAVLAGTGCYTCASAAGGFVTGFADAKLKGKSWTDASLQGLSEGAANATFTYGFNKVFKPPKFTKPKTFRQGFNVGSDELFGLLKKNPGRPANRFSKAWFFGKNGVFGSNRLKNTAKYGLNWLATDYLLKGKIWKDRIWDPSMKWMGGKLSNFFSSKGRLDKMKRFIIDSPDQSGPDIRKMPDAMLYPWEPGYVDSFANYA